MIEWFVSSLRGNPELALFLAIGLGFWLGSRKFGSFSLGAVTGSLLAALLIGRLDIEVPGLVKTVLFMLFLFGTGYSVGPQFFRSLKGDGLRALAFTIVHCGAGLGVAYAMARLLGLDIGLSAGPWLLLGGVVVTMVPLVVAFVFGRYVLRMPPMLLIGAMAGAQTHPPALAAVQKIAESQTPVLGYTVPYALASILLTMWGSFMVLLRFQVG